jgi:hypothetical protein
MLTKDKETIKQEDIFKTFNSKLKMCVGIHLCTKEGEKDMMNCCSVKLERQNPCRNQILVASIHLSAKIVKK